MDDKGPILNVDGPSLLKIELHVPRQELERNFEIFQNSCCPGYLPDLRYHYNLLHLCPQCNIVGHRTLHHYCTGMNRPPRSCI
jgi:hypothetical protein